MDKINFNDPKVITKIAECIENHMVSDDQGPYDEYPAMQENAIFQEPEEIGSGGEGYAPTPDPISPKETQGYAPGTTSIVEDGTEETESCGCEHPTEEMDLEIDKLFRLDSGEEDTSDGKEVVQEFVISPFS
jgi:hypothetical protein